MTLKTSWHQPKRLGATAMTLALLLQTVSPAYAAVLQVPGIYQAPPLPNVMFTLDDSGSMTSDAIPDYPRNVAGMPTNDGSSSLTGSGFGSQFPSMWKAGTQYLEANLTVTGTQPYGNYYQSSNPIARYLRSRATESSARRNEPMCLSSSAWMTSSAMVAVHLRRSAHS